MKQKVSNFKMMDIFDYYLAIYFEEEYLYFDNYKDFEYLVD